MALNIVVCVKSVPSNVNVPVDSATGQPKTAGVPPALNPYDEYAIEEAVRLKERVPGSTAVAVTVGPESAAEVLREAVARGVDAGVHVTGPEFEGGDSLAAAAALAAAVKKLHAEKPVHLALFGKNTSDGGSGTVGAQAAEALDWPSALGVRKIESVDESAAVVSRSVEDGVEAIRLALPACVGTVKEINEPRLPSLKGKMAAKKAAFAKWGAADLGLSSAGAAASGAKVAKASAPPARPAGVRVEGGDASEKARKLVDILVERKLI